MSLTQESSQTNVELPDVEPERPRDLVTPEGGSLPTLLVATAVTWTTVAAMMIAIWMYSVSDTGRPRHRLARGGPGGSAIARSGLSGDPRRGRELFNTTCIACHGPTGAGIPKLGANLRESRFVARKTDAELIDFVKKGRQPGEPNSVLGLMMPPKGGNPAMDDASLKDVIAFIRTLQAEAGVSVAGAN